MVDILGVLKRKVNIYSCFLMGSFLKFVPTPEELNRCHAKVSFNLTSESRKQTLVQDTSFYSGNA